jgi:hypothetical protein
MLNQLELNEEIKISLKMSRRSPFCLCLHESENKLPRTKRCRRPCGAQYSILAERERSQPQYQMEELKTSQEWYTQLYPNHEVVIMDPDGWDRSNYDYSFKEEKITLAEFNRRLLMSTVMRYKQ